MNIRDLDLNLLVVFDAIYRERSIGAAGERLGLSQPAVSNALRRLLDFTGDKLFFRSGSEMVPTHVATVLAKPVSEALASMGAILTSLSQFDPKTTTRHFHVGYNDLYRTILTPALAKLFADNAPRARLEMVPQSDDVEELLTSIRNGATELAIMPAAHVDTTMGHEIILEEQLVFAVRNGHPALGQPVTKETLGGLRHVVTSENQSGRLLVEASLRKAGITRDIACIMPDVSIIPAIVEVTDFVAVTGLGFVQRYMRDHAITVLEAPVSLPRLRSALVWSKNFNDDPGHKWLRSKVSSILRAAISPAPVAS